MNNSQTAWDFVIEHYPNYSSCAEIADNNDLKVLIDGEEKEGSKAWELKQEIINDYRCVFPYHSYDEREEYRMQVAEEIKNRYNESCEYIYEKAIEAFQEKQAKTVSVNWSISDVDQVMEDNDVDYPLTEYGKFKVLQNCKENFDANASYWDNLLESVNRIINQSRGILSE